MYILYPLCVNTASLIVQPGIFAHVHIFASAWNGKHGDVKDTFLSGLNHILVHGTDMHITYLGDWIYSSATEIIGTPVAFGGGSYTQQCSCSIAHERQKITLSLLLRSHCTSSDRLVMAVQMLVVPCVVCSISNISFMRKHVFIGVSSTTHRGHGFLSY
jgi:hypothetical protein